MYVNAPKDRKHWPPETNKGQVPPAASHILLNPNPKPDPNERIAIWTAANGKEQSGYPKTHHAVVAEVKWERIDRGANAKFGAAWALMKKSATDTKVQQQLAAKAAINPKSVPAHAECDQIMALYGLRVGGSVDTGARCKGGAKPAGATTLLGSHVKPQPDGTARLQFFGKHCQPQDVAVPDKALAKMLVSRSKKASANGELFPDVTDKTMLRYNKALFGPDAKNHDLRARVGTNKAIEAMDKMQVPKTEKAYKDAIKHVSEVVSQQLGNRPKEAFENYINPAVWAEWKKASGVS